MALRASSGAISAAPQEQSGIAHFVEHMLFKGTDTRSAEDIAQAIDSIGGQLDAFTAKEYASYYIKVLDEHLPLAVDLLADIVLRPAFSPDEIEREKKVILEEIKMVEDTPDDLVHEIFVTSFGILFLGGRRAFADQQPVLAFDPDVDLRVVRCVRRRHERSHRLPVGRRVAEVHRQLREYRGHHLL